MGPVSCLFSRLWEWLRYLRRFASLRSWFGSIHACVIRSIRRGPRHGSQDLDSLQPLQRQQLWPSVLACNSSRQ